MTDKPIASNALANSRARRAADTTSPLMPTEPAPAVGPGELPSPPSAAISGDPWTLLAAPFPRDVVEIKPGAVAEEKKRALALAYVDARHYQARLDSVVGPAGWNVEYRPLSDRAVLCRLTVLGIVREDVGEEATNDPNQATSAAMQAFKRACAAFGL